MIRKNFKFNERKKYNMDGKRAFVIGEDEYEYEDIPIFMLTQRRRHKLEELIEIYNMEDCPSEAIPTRKQVYEYGILTEMLEDLKNELGELYLEEAKSRWKSLNKK